MNVFNNFALHAFYIGIEIENFQRCDSICPQVCWVTRVAVGSIECYFSSNFWKAWIELRCTLEFSRKAIFFHFITLHSSRTERALFQNRMAAGLYITLKSTLPLSIASLFTSFLLPFYFGKVRFTKIEFCFSNNIAIASSSSKKCKRRPLLMFNAISRKCKVVLLLVLSVPHLKKTVIQG